MKATGELSLLTRSEGGMPTVPVCPAKLSVVVAAKVGLQRGWEGVKGNTEVPAV